MPDNRSFVPEFALKVLLPTLVAATGISLLILYVFGSVFRETDNLDRSYARGTAQSAIQSLREKMETLVQDNAYWDDAVVATSGTLDKQWLFTTWGISKEQSIYDSSFVIDIDGKTLWASTREDPQDQTGISANAYFNGGLSSLLKHLPKNGTTFARTSGIFKTGDTISIVAAAVIVPWSSTVAPAPGGPRRLLLVRSLSPGVLQSLGNEFQLKDLHFAKPGEMATSFIQLKSAEGRQLGLLAWTDRRPGSTLRAKFVRVVWGVVSLFLLVIGILVYIIWRGFKRAHDSRAEAVNSSLRDDLTGLANRRELMRVLTTRLAEVKARKENLSVVYADLDGFKEVNDAYGHEIGDQLLKWAANGFAFLARETDLVARLGGDEFAIIISGSDSKVTSRELARNMIAFFAEPMVFGGRVASVSVSVGIVDLTEGEIDVEEMLRRADVAMYAAKSGGRNRAQVYDQCLDIKRNEGRAIARELRDAIDRGLLRVVYQPIVGARSRRIMGVEALVRWPAESARNISPEVFVPVAEEFGLIEDLGQFVLTEACRQGAAWPDIFISVNVSPIQFMNPNFAETVERTLARTGLDARRLEVEVTEGFVIDNAERATTIIGKLHDMQVTVALDDFGIGYSSIGHLRRFNFDKLKLDSSMVVDILRQPAALRLVQGTIAMADALGLRVTAEGIEDENQVSVLRLAGCSLFQGFLFSEPVEAHRISQFLGEEATALAG
jgi:diguanylate cyclase (GGDEF)-like protein